MATRKSKTKRYYFTEKHEEAIVKYAKTNDIKVRTELYVVFIQPAFSELVDKIVFTYKFSNLPNIDLLRDECKIWLTTILDKFDPSKGSKAFSYFSVITKNWFIHKVKKNTQRHRREIQFEDLSKDAEHNHMSVSDHYDKKREQAEFWGHLWKQIEFWSQENLRTNERKVLEAIKILLQNSDNIEIFNKKAIYLYLRELTGLNTKQVVNNLNKMRARYQSFKKDWNEGKI
jgi:DNA-directed RNA polymerase specialized sigma subunit|tara:strand:+ start:1845 stop:2534 length:690 start_codon:yes stop_codon:yes gene_type:complete